MLLQSLKLAGWRSFAPDHPAEISDLGVTNLLIGPNNVGKSNLGRFLVRIRDILHDYRQISPWATISRPFYEPLDISFRAEEIDHWLRESIPINADITIPLETLSPLHPLPPIVTKGDVVRFSIQMTSDGTVGRLSVVPLSVDGQPVLIYDGSYKLLLSNGTYTENVTNGFPHRGLALAACQLLARSILEIKPLRDPMRTSTPTDGNQSTDGGDIINELLSRQNDVNQQGFWTKFKADLEKWFAILLGERDVRIDVNNSGFWLEAKRAGSTLRSSLPDLGAGVSEILMVLAYLRLHHDRKFLVIIDEPEAHLHPGAVVELIKIITESLPNHQLLVTTHSTALVDAVTPEWRTVRVMRAAQHEGTSFEALNTTQQELGLLADLGVRPSQLFLARVALWVEGPSDVHYMTALLREVDPKLIPGRDFTFVTYGGASSSHLDVVDEEEGNNRATERLVHVLEVSHRAVIICDRDRNTTDKERELVNRLIAAADKVPQNACTWTYSGREIENAVREDVLKRVLEEVRPKRFNTTPPTNLGYGDYQISDNDAFDDVVAKAAMTKDGQPLTSDQTSNIKVRLNQRKNEIARRVREIGVTEPVFKDSALQLAQQLVTWLTSDPKPITQ